MNNKMRLCFLGCLLLFILAFFPGMRAACAASVDQPDSMAVKRENRKTFVLPSSLQIIEEEAFEGTEASEVIMPDGVQEIGDRAFFNMPDLRMVFIPRTVVKLGADLFSDKGVTIYGEPGSSAEDYAKANHLVFQAVDAVIADSAVRTAQEDRPVYVFKLLYAIAISHLLVLCLSARRNCEVNPMERKKRVVLCSLDACFP